MPAMHKPSQVDYSPLPRSSTDSPSRPPRPRRISPLHRKIRIAYRLLTSILLAIFCLVAFTGLYNPSYAHAPPYSIPPTERIYIAANIIDDTLIDGVWGRALERLVNSIGKDRVYVSVYGGPKASLERLEERLGLGDRSTILAENESPIPSHDIPHIKLASGTRKIKRIAYLAEVRNKALEPLGRATEAFDKVLFINDVVFEPEDALRLLWGTRVVDGKASYRAACAIDFVNPFKFYDTFATRDLEGYSIGVPFYPWFADVGHAYSRDDVREGTDAVRVRSCWGGMVAFDAAFFQERNVEDTSLSTADAHPLGTKTNTNISIHTEALRFRSEPDPFWDASECCLINADIQSEPDLASPSPTSGIYMNPFVRVAYSPLTYKLTFFIARFEKLFVVPQGLISRFAGLPRRNPRREERAGSVVSERVWVFDEAGADAVEEVGGADEDLAKGIIDIATASKQDIEQAVVEMGKLGAYHTFNRTASPGGFCGTRQLLVLRQGVVHGKNWVNLVIPLP